MEFCSWYAVYLKIAVYVDHGISQWNEFSNDMSHHTEK